MAAKDLLLLEEGSIGLFHRWADGGLVEGAPVERGWSLTLVPDAREAGGCFGRLGKRERASASGPAADPARALEEAARRARTKTRRFCVANRLTRFWTLTCDGDGCHDPKQVKADVAEFFRELRRLLGGQSFPYLWTAEWHHTNHGLHVHFVVGRYIKRSMIYGAWGWQNVPGRGFVFGKLIGDLPVGSSAVDESRRVPGYLSKYVGKDFDAQRFPKGWHRYEVAQGFQPAEIRLLGRTDADVIAKASAIMGGRPDVYWSSAQEADWGDKPPAVWVQWCG